MSPLHEYHSFKTSFFDICICENDKHAKYTIQKLQNSKNFNICLRCNGNWIQKQTWQNKNVKKYLEVKFQLK